MLFLAIVNYFNLDYLLHYKLLKVISPYVIIENSRLLKVISPYVIFVYYKLFHLRLFLAILSNFNI
jgi:hypothetical protein